MRVAPYDAVSSAGIVPSPNAAIVNAPRAASICSAAIISSEYTNPHGIQPQIIPNATARGKLATGSSRRPSGDSTRPDASTQAARRILQQAERGQRAEQQRDGGQQAQRAANGLDVEPGNDAAECAREQASRECVRRDATELVADQQPKLRPSGRAARACEPQRRSDTAAHQRAMPARDEAEQQCGAGRQQVVHGPGFRGFAVPASSSSGSSAGVSRSSN